MRRGVSFHIWSATADVAPLFGAAFPRCHCFRFPLGPEASRPRQVFFFCPCVFSFFSSPSVWPLEALEKFSELGQLCGELPLGRAAASSSSTMGDAEAAEETRPRQSVLLAVLPSREFATSRKGLLLIAEVVRRGAVGFGGWGGGFSLFLLCWRFFFSFCLFLQGLISNRKRRKESRLKRMQNTAM